MVRKVEMTRWGLPPDFGQSLAGVAMTIAFGQVVDIAKRRNGPPVRF